jgi:hypothetical protein
MVTSAHSAEGRKSVCEHLNRRLDLYVHFPKNHGSTTSCIKQSTLHLVCTPQTCKSYPRAKQQLLLRDGYHPGRSAKRGDFVQSDSVSERYVLCPDRTVLRCRCGESLVLLGREEDWYSEGRSTFECHRCRGPISLADRLDEGRGQNFIGDSDSIRGFDEEA